MELRDKFEEWYKLVKKESRAQRFKDFNYRKVFSVEEETRLNSLDVYIKKNKEYFCVNYQDLVNSILNYLNGIEKGWQIEYSKKIHNQSADIFQKPAYGYVYDVYFVNKGKDSKLFLDRLEYAKEKDDQISGKKGGNLSIDLQKLTFSDMSCISLINDEKTRQKLAELGLNYGNLDKVIWDDLEEVIWNVVKRNQVLKLQQKLREKNKIQKIQERKVVKTAKEIKSIEEELKSLSD